MIQISSRERLLALGLTVVLAGWATWALAVQPTRRRIQTLERIIPEKQAQLQELGAASIEYTALQDQFQALRARMAAQDPNFHLSAFLETMIQRHKLAGHLTTMQEDVRQPQPDYSETVVTIDLQDITLRQLVEFLTAVETSDAVIQVGSLHIRKDVANDALLDSTVGVVSPRLTALTPLAQAP